MLKRIFIFLFGKKDFAMKHSKIISSFAKASEEAKKLELEMIDHIKAKEEHIATVLSEIEAVQIVKRQSAKFSLNLSKLIGDEEITTVVNITVVNDKPKAGEEVL